MRGFAGVIAVFALAVLAAPASGSFPGRNGRIVFASDRRADLQPQIFAVPAAGGAARNVSRRPAYRNAAPDAQAGLLVYESGPAAGFGSNGMWLVTRAGAQRRLGTGVAPALSPDGTRVLAVDSRLDAMFVLDVRSGARIRLADVGSPGSWSPDGRRVAYADANGVELVRADASERRTIPLVFPPANRPSWSPDGRRLVVEEGGFSDDNEHVVKVVDVATGGATAIGSGSQPAWSPDGAHIAYVRGNGIVVARPDGTDVRPLTAPPDGDGDLSPAWSPDGRAIAYVRLHPRLDASASALGIAELSGGRRFVTPATGHLVDPFGGIGSFGGITWSTDGQTIYYASSSLRDVFHLFTVRSDFRGLRQLTRGGHDDREPVWAPDARRVAFVRDGDELVVLDRGRERVVAEQVEMSSPTWSPEGHRLAYAAGAAVWVVDVRRAGRRGLVGGSQPAWSPAGRWIAYVNNGLRLVHPDGTGDHWLKADDDFLYREPTWSPRGDVLYYVVMDRCGGSVLLCGGGGVIAAIRPFAQPPADVGLPSLAGDKPAVSPDGRFLVFGGAGLHRTPISGVGTSFGMLSYATDVEPDWQRVKAPPARRRARATWR